MNVKIFYGRTIKIVNNDRSSVTGFCLYPGIQRGSKRHHWPSFILWHESHPRPNWSWGWGIGPGKAEKQTSIRPDLAAKKCFSFSGKSTNLRDARSFHPGANWAARPAGNKHPGCLAAPPFPGCPATRGRYWSQAIAIPTEQVLLIQPRNTAMDSHESYRRTTWNWNAVDLHSHSTLDTLLTTFYFLLVLGIGLWVWCSPWGGSPGTLCWVWSLPASTRSPPSILNPTSAEPTEETSSPSFCLAAPHPSHPELAHFFISKAILDHQPSRASIPSSSK
jgi:hypothetical protein